MARPESLGVQFGAFAPPLGEQLSEQGLAIDDAQVLEKLERGRTSVAYLYIHGFLSEGERERASKRVMKAITQAVNTTLEKSQCASSTTS